MDLFFNFILKDMGKKIYNSFFHSILNFPNTPIEKLPICCALILWMSLLVFIVFVCNLFKWMLKDEEKLFAELFWFVIDHIKLSVFYIIEKLRIENLKLLIVLILNKCGLMRQPRQPAVKPIIPKVTKSIPPTPPPQTPEIKVVNKDLTNNNIEDKLCDQLAGENLSNQGFDDLSKVPVTAKASDESSLKCDDSSEDKEPAFIDSFHQLEYVDSFIYPVSVSLSTIPEEVSIIDSNDSVFASMMHEKETLDTNMELNMIWCGECHKGVTIEKEKNLMMSSISDSTIKMAEKNKKKHLDKAKSSEVKRCINKSQTIKTTSKSHILKSPKKISNYKKNDNCSNVRSISSQVPQTKLSVKLINQKSYYNVKRQVTNCTTTNDEEILAKKPKREKSPDINANLQNSNKTVHVEPCKLKQCKSLDDSQHNKRSTIDSPGRSSDLSPRRSSDARMLKKQLSVNDIALVPHNIKKDKINPLNTPQLTKLTPNTTIRKSNIPVLSNNNAFQLKKSLHDLTFALGTSIIEGINDDSYNDTAQNIVDYLKKTEIKQQQQQLQEQSPSPPPPSSAHKQNQANKNANAISTATASKKPIIIIGTTKPDDADDDGSDEDYGKKLKKSLSLKQFIDKCEQNMSKDKKAKTENDSTTSKSSTTISTTDFKKNGKRSKPATS